MNYLNNSNIIFIFTTLTLDYTQNKVHSFLLYTQSTQYKLMTIIIFIGFMISNSNSSFKNISLLALTQVLLLISLVVVSNTAECHGNPGQKQVNLLPIWKG